MELNDWILYVNFPVMPQGVEHKFKYRSKEFFLYVNFPVMPQGVEHIPSKFPAINSPREFPCDAARR